MFTTMEAVTLVTLPPSLKSHVRMAYNPWILSDLTGEELPNPNQIYCISAVTLQSPLQHPLVACLRVSLEICPDNPKLLPSSVNISCVDVGILTVKREVCGDQSNLVLTMILISAILLQR